MRSLYYSCFAALWLLVFESSLWAQDCEPFLSTTVMASMPEAVANNAVVEGMTSSGERYIYSFAGIDTSKIFSGIHLKSWRYSVTNDQWEAIADLPDTLGKVAAGASHLDGIIYIVGGYHVFGDGGELSSKRLHRFDCTTNSYLSDGADIPVEIDDHVQAVWNDSLIYVITGWRNTTNVINVQIYDPAQDTWTEGTPVPPNNIYRSFGASGVIDGNTIYYFGGASLGPSFPIQPFLRIGEINPANPQEISWRDTTFGNDTALYRAAAVMLNRPTWLGGSRTTYNYDGIAYNGSGSVEPSQAIQQWTGEQMLVSNCMELNMDFRGVAHFRDEGTVFLAGGMESGQQVSDKLLRLTYSTVGLDEKSEGETELQVYPNPTHGIVSIQSTERVTSVKGYNTLGEEVLNEQNPVGIDWLKFADDFSGMVTLKLETESGIVIRRVIVR